MIGRDEHLLSPTPKASLCNRLLGIELRRVREAAGFTMADLAARSSQFPAVVNRLEKGLTNELVTDPTVQCAWGPLATSMVDVLCRASERIDIFAPLGINPALGRLDADRCTAYVLESATVDRRDVTLRVLQHAAGVYPGIEHHPLTRFSLPDGTAVVFYAYVHAARFTQEPDHLLAAHTLFEQLAQFTRHRRPR
ncbi:Scr1 family TA system antitoxin-like transcriptional regulator [Actinosynnema sp. NPDC050436]|uniref:Scr1 family TA system antitoxin-like transcriptional regulator n=1 Tax=Actinosynnema sp. NPDC050436 TaxID=3155659 RepID=UPI0033E06359